MKTQVIEVHPEFPDLDQINYCANIIKRGGLVIFPTETVYGIAANYSNPQAMQRLRDVKKRSDNKHFSVLISQRGLISNYTNFSDPKLYKLLYTYWPGPLTVVVPSKEPGKTIGVRMPNNTIALRLMQESQCVVAAPSANFEGSPPPSTCQEALAELDGLVDVAIDGGPTQIGLGSTVVDLSSGSPKVLREGVITQEKIDEVTRQKSILFVCTGNSCRSVMAEYMLRAMLRGRKDVKVLSAGTGVFIQSTASAETLSVLRDEGIDATHHISQPVNTLLLKQADLIFVMTRTHRMQVLERVPEVENRVYLLREFTQNSIDMPVQYDIPDPIGRSTSDYRDCLRVIKEAIHKIVELV